MNKSSQFSKFRIVIAALFCTLSAWAQVDVTSTYIVNPAPTANLDGWTVSESPSQMRDDIGVAEFWNKSGASLRQTINSLPAGTYKLTAIAFTRTGMTATLFAGNNSMNIATVSNTTVNTLATASTWLDAGNGVNELEFTVTSTSNVTIGLQADDSYSDHWMVWRSFKLEKYDSDLIPLTVEATSGGQVTYGTSAVTDSRTFYLSEGDDAVLTITPNTYYELKSVIKNGTTNITSQVTNGQLTLSNITSATTITVTFGLKDLDWDSANASNPLDITHLVVNPDFEELSANGWTTIYESGAASNVGYQTASYSNGSVTVSHFIEAWRPSTLGDISIEQTLDGLPQGTYLLEADVIASSNASGAYLFLKGTNGENTKAVSTENAKPQHYSVSFTKTNSGSLTIGVKTVSTTANWLAADNFQLKYLGSGSDVGEECTVTYNVTFNGKVVATATEQVAKGSALPAVPTSLNNDFVTLTKTGTHPTTVTSDVTVTYAATFTGPFEFSTSLDEAKWYNLTIRSSYYVGKTESEPYSISAVNETTRATDAYQWAFGGDPYHIKIYNRTTGFDQTLTKEGTYAVMRSGDYTWDMLSYSDGFIIRETGTAYNCLNQYGGIGGTLQFWNSSSATTDPGSIFHVEEVPSNNNNEVTNQPLITSVSQLSSPYTETLEGAIGNLIDNDVTTFWHSAWSSGSVTLGTHYLQATMPQGEYSLVVFQFTRRSVPNDHTIEWSVRGTNSASAAKADCEELLHAETPFTSNTETLTSEPFSTKGYKYLRFYSEEQYPSSRGYFHLAEFQIYPVESDVNVESLTITVSEGGLVTYNTSTISNATKTYSINEGTDAVFTITPNSGYELKSVTLNGSTDVTSQVTNGQLTISNITSATTIAVTFSMSDIVDPTTDYERALAAIQDGASYRISTDVNGTKYYVTEDGKLTSTKTSGGIFTITKVSSGTYQEYGYRIDSGSLRFTNPPLNNNAANLTPGIFATTSNDRADWERQVLFLNTDGKYAVRSCNTAEGTTSWNDAGRTYWTWGIESVPTPQYSYTPTYVWQFELEVTIQVTYELYDTDGTTIIDSVTKQQESYSEINIPAELTSNYAYDYVTTGTIGDADCTIKVTRTPKSGKVHALSELSNSKAYTIHCDRGSFITADNHLASTSNSSYASAQPSSFAIISYQNRYYLYSVSDKKFVTNSGTLADAPNSTDDAVIMEAKTDSYFFFYFSINGSNNGLNTSSGYTYGIIINTWANVDAGNQYYMIEEADFDATEALSQLNATFNGQSAEEYNAEYATYIATYPYNKSSLIPSISTWDGGLSELKGQHWDGTSNSTYYEQTAGQWSQSSWTSSSYTSLTLPAGKYVVMVAGRSAASTNIEAYMQLDNTKVVFPAKGDVGLGVDINGVGTMSSDSTYANNNAGRGWEYRYIAFESDGKTPVKLTLGAAATASYQWMSFTQPILLAQSANDSPIIQFTDAAVKAICISATYTNETGEMYKWDANGDGELSEAEAAAVKDIGTVFQDNKEITSFDELQYFTGLTTIGEAAFTGCSSLTSITIPNSVTSIGDFAFTECSGLSSITIPSSVTYFGTEAFYDCNSLESIIVETGNTSYDSRNNCNAIIETTTNSLIAGCKNTIIPNSVISIGDAAFSGCSGLKSITIPNSVTSIGMVAFAYCSGLESIIVETGNTSYDSRNNCNAIIRTSTKSLIVGCKNTIIPNSVTSIGDDTFWGCSGLTSIIIPNSVTSIGLDAFRECGGLSSITIPNSVTSIGAHAFNGCSGLKSITSYITTPYDINHEVFDGIDNSSVLNVPYGTKALYEQTDGWHENFNQIIEMENPNPSITITANNKMREYGETNPTLTYTVSDSTYSSKPKISCSATATSPVGTYPIVISSADSLSNSNVTYVNGTLTITKAPLTVSVKSVTREQGQVNPEFEITYSGFKNGETDSVLTQKPTVTCNATAASPIGSYPITVSGATAQNYDITYVNGTLTVTELSPYAVLSNNNTVLTFYYDDQKESRGGRSVGPFSSPSDRGWDNQKETITTVVFDASFANYTSLTSTAYWFHGLSQLTAITGIKNLKTDNVTNMSYMFAGCSSLTSLDVSSFKTDNVTNMNFLFYSCSGLTSLDVSGFKTDNVTKMTCMFYVCSSLTSLDVSGFKTDNVTEMIGMFGGCYSLTSLDVSGFKTDNVKSMSSMFESCTLLTSLDVSGFKTDNVTDMSYMFTQCFGLTSLDLSGFKTDNVTNMKSMFHGCSNLGTIYIGEGWTTRKVTEGYGVFSGCYQLVGSQGTVYNESHIDYTYAHVDEGTSNPGYLSEIISIASFVTNGMTFKVTSQAMKKVTYVNGPAAEQITVPSEVAYDGNTYSVTAIADSAFAGQAQLKSVKIPSSVKAAGKNLFAGSSHVAAIIWEAPLKMTKEMAGTLTDNPNLLFYTSDTAYAPNGVTNIINSQTKQAERIVLSDGDNNDFYCPEEFTASSISYTHAYQLFTVSGQCQGWESLVLPFDVTEIKHETKGVITPFGALQIGHEFDNGTKPFWLYEYTTGGRFAEADGIKANVPYILSMPNESRFSDEYILAGNITFKATNATVKATSGAKTVKSGYYSFTPSYQNGTSEMVYLLNVDKNYDGNPKGSVFVKNDLLERQARPFEAYFQLSGSAGVKSFFSIFDELTDGIRSIEPAKRNANAEYYQLDGTKRSTLQRGFNIIRTKDNKAQKVFKK